MKKSKQGKTAPAKSVPMPSIERPPVKPLLSAGSFVLLSALLVLLAVVPYINTFANEFVLDDIWIIVKNPRIQSLSNIGKILTTDYWGEVETADRGLYRPLTLYTYAVDHAIWKLKPTGYHLTNLALHALCTLLLFLIGVRVLGSPVGAFLAAAIFAVHPVHTEAVTGVVGRAEILAALFFMLALWLTMAGRFSWLRPDRRTGAVGSRVWLVYGASALFYFLGLLSKETAVTLPALLLVYDLIYRRKNGPASLPKKKPAGASQPTPLFWRYVGFGIVLLLYFAMRSKAVAASHAVWTGFIEISTDDRVLTASRILMEYVGLLVFPRTLSADYWIPDVPIAHSPAEPLVLLSLFLWLALGLVAVVCWRRARPLFFALAWFFITIFPVSNLPFPLGLAKAERILYLPSAGFCLFLGGLYGWLEKKARRKWLLLLPLFPILFLGIVRTYGRNADWKDEFTLALATLKVSPTSPVFNRIAASEYRKRGELGKVVPLLQEVARQLYWDPYHQLNLGNAYLDLKQYDQAVACYEAALRLQPGHHVALYNLGQALSNLGPAQMQAGKNAEAVKTYTRMLSLDRNQVGGYLNLGAAYVNLRNFPEAARVSREGLALFPNHAGLHFNLATALKQMGQATAADPEYQKAIALDPSLKKMTY
jgi:tetratricopeptide (TPR) repeat protein